MKLGNIFANCPDRSEDEVVTLLVEKAGMRIERILSTGQASPPGFWFDQPDAEWVMVVSGSAILQFEGDAEATIMGAGDHVLIPPHRRHRVQSTDPVTPTVWLAVHFAETA